MLDWFNVIRMDFHFFSTNETNIYESVWLLASTSDRECHRQLSTETLWIWWKKRPAIHIQWPSRPVKDRIVLQCRHGRFPMTNIISQAVSAALCRVPAALHRSARTIVRPSTLTIAPDFRQRKFNASRYRVRNYSNKRNCTRSVPNIIISSTFFFYVLFCNFFLVFERNYLFFL